MILLTPAIICGYFGVRFFHFVESQLIISWIALRRGLRGRLVAKPSSWVTHSIRHLVFHAVQVKKTKIGSKLRKKYGVKTRVLQGDFFQKTIQEIF